MKIMFLITALDGLTTGKGGYYYSFRTTVEALSSAAEVFIVILGEQAVPPLSNSDIKTYRVAFNGRNLKKTYTEIKTLVLSERPSVLHAFDPHSYLFCRYIQVFSGIPAFLTKCGGPNPPYYYPGANDLILYSQENLAFFQAQKKYQTAHLHFIPNRVVPVIEDADRISALREHYKIDEQEAVFLRIARFSQHYKESILQAIDLISTLRQKGYRCRLLCIGTIQSQEVFQEIQSVADKAGDGLSLITENRFTVNAAQLIGVSDVVIGTGRGIMEAASFSKVLLTTLSGARFPVLVREENFEVLFDTNFSPRNAIASFKEDTELELIAQLVADSGKREQYSRFAAQVFQTYFDINRRVPDFLALYHNAISRKGSPMPKGELALHTLTVLKNANNKWWKPVWKRLRKKIKHGA